MENTKALEVAEYLKIIPDATVRQVQQACGLSSSSLAHRYMLQARGFNLTQKQKLALDSKEIATLRAQLAERDAQLAAERAMADRLADFLKDIENGRTITFKDRDGEIITSYHRDIVSHALDVYEKYKTTRQPAQDKGGE